MFYADRETSQTSQDFLLTKRKRKNRRPPRNDTIERSSSCLTYVDRDPSFSFFLLLFPPISSRQVPAAPTRRLRPPESCPAAGRMGITRYMRPSGSTYMKEKKERTIKIKGPTRRCKSGRGPISSLVLHPTSSLAPSSFSSIRQPSAQICLRREEK